MLLTGTLGPVHATVRGKNGRIAYRRYLNQAQTRGAIFTIRRNGTGVRQLTHPRRGFVTDEPDYSPNGRWIVYQVEKKGEFPIRLFKIRRNGSNRTYLSTGCGRICGDAFASWSPGGKRLAFQRESCGIGPNNLLAIYVMRADGTHARRVSHKNATCATRHPLEDHAPQWAPNGKRLAFERLNHNREKQAIFTIRLDGTGAKRLTPWRIDASQPDWSPNGRWIAFRTQEQSETRGNIALVHPDGTGLHRITNGHGKYKWLSCSFSPNGKKIQAGRFPGRGKAGNADIYVMNLDGSGRRNLTRSSAWESASDWGPR
jgi:Tol biopolymer transport system component